MESWNFQLFNEGGGNGGTGDDDGQLTRHVTEFPPLCALERRAGTATTAAQRVPEQLRRRRV